MKSSRFPILLLAGIFVLASISCSLAGGLQASPASQELTPELEAENPNVVEPTLAPTLVPEAQAPEAAAETPAPPAAQEAPPAEAGGCSEAVCIQEGTFLLARPIGPEGRNDIDTSSWYGTLNKKTREMYHGVQFLNSTGTAVLAAADGEVVVAGDDSKTLYGLGLNSLGNLVILRHSLPGISEPVYTLYAHLSELSVKVDDVVSAGQQIGLVGMSGSVSGSTMYFEVRLGENSYDATRNPELWMSLLPDATGAPTGALIGRVLDRDGKYLGISNILIEPVQKSVQALIRRNI